LGTLYPLSIAFNVDGAGRVGMGTTTPTAGLHVSSNAGVLATGTFGVGSIPTEGPGARMMWYPGKAALRAGAVSSGSWDDANVGNYSVGLGFESFSPGNYSFATGFQSAATGDGSVALGASSSASGLSSAAIGDSSTAIGDYSTALGDTTTATGISSTALGHSTQANGESSTALGRTTVANGFASTSMGEATTAGGSQSVAMGLATLADSSVSTAIGRYNVGGGDPLNWVDTDPLFEVGIGTGLAARANAVTILKSGNVGISTTNPRNPLHIAAAGTDSGGILGLPQVVARLRQSTPGQASAIAIDALAGQDSILYLSEAGAAVWDLRNESASSDDLTINHLGATTMMTIKTSGLVGIGRNPTANRLEVEGAASKTTAGSWFANSDRRIKTEIRGIEGALETLERVRPVVFRYTDEYRRAHPSIEDKDYYNVVAQEFAEAFPEYVKPSGEGDILQVDTYPMQVCAVAAVKELHSIVREREGRIAELEGRLQAQDDRIASLEKVMAELVKAVGDGR